MMKHDRSQDVSGARPAVRPQPGHTIAVALLAMLLAAGGMNGATCSITPTTPGGSTGCNDSDSGAGGPIISTDDHIIGDASASVTVVEYEDFQ